MCRDCQHWKAREAAGWAMKTTIGILWRIAKALFLCAVIGVFSFVMLMHAMHIGGWVVNWEGKVEGWPATALLIGAMSAGPLLMFAYLKMPPPAVVEAWVGKHPSVKTALGIAGMILIVAFGSVVLGFISMVSLFWLMAWNPHITPFGSHIRLLAGCSLGPLLLLGGTAIAFGVDEWCRVRALAPGGAGETVVPFERVKANPD